MGFWTQPEEKNMRVSMEIFEKTNLGVVGRRVRGLVQEVGHSTPRQALPQVPKRHPGMFCRVHRLHHQQTEQRPRFLFLVRGQLPKLKNINKLAHNN